MRTPTASVRPHGSACSAPWASTAAARASGARPQAAKTASPTLLKATPAWVVILSWRIVSWRARAAGIAWGWRSHKRVLPSISVNRNVTVPRGSGVAGRGSEAYGHALGHLPGRAAHVGLDFPDRLRRAADPPRQVALGQIERSAPPPQPVAERVGLVDHVPSPVYHFLCAFLCRRPVPAHRALVV